MATFGLEDILTLEASRQKKLPWVPTDAQRKMLANGASLRDVGANIPFLAEYTPKGWIQWHEVLFVDTSGRGAPNEPALTQKQLGKVIAGDPPGLGYALVECGRFQGWIARYNCKKAEGVRMTPKELQRTARRLLSSLRLRLG